MNRPIYEEFDLTKPHEGHAGLWYEKYCNQWHVIWPDRSAPLSPPKWTLKADGDTAPKLNWVNTVTGTGYVKGPGETLLKEHHERLQKLCKSPNGLTLNFQTTSRLVIGSMDGRLFCFG